MSFKFRCLCVNVITRLWQHCWNVAAECRGQSTVKPRPCETSQRETLDCYCARQQLAFHVHSVQVIAETLSLPYKSRFKETIEMECLLQAFCHFNVGFVVI